MASPEVAVYSVARTSPVRVFAAFALTLIVICVLFLDSYELFTSVFVHRDNYQGGATMIPRDTSRGSSTGNSSYINLQDTFGGSLRYRLEINSTAIWPQVNVIDDRILAQLAFSDESAPNLNSRTNGCKPKRIVVYNGADLHSGDAHFQNCAVNQCTLSSSMRRLDQADAVLFHGAVPDQPPERMRADQVWILYLLESPVHTQQFGHYARLINWTATYRRDSTLVTPYEKFVAKDHKALSAKDHEALSDGTVDYVRGKTKKIAWFVSNCYTSNERMEYVRELQKYVQVDIFGDCGPLRCEPGQHESTCWQTLKDHYFFYLAFENSNCRDYITEKFFRNALLNSVVPLVMGAPRENYEQVAPPMSFIHVDDFRSPLEVASYLHSLVQNHTLYNEYFAWRATGHFIDTKFWCRLCAMLQDGGGHVTWYEDLETWWRNPDVCRVSGGSDSRWPSWANNATEHRMV